MKFKRILFFIAMITSFLFQLDSNQVFAVTANPNPVRFIQPDGSALTIILKGDEFIHWAVTSDGYTLLSNKNGAYEYAMLSSDGKMTFSGIQANDPGNRVLQEKDFLSGIHTGLFFSNTQITEMKLTLRKGQLGKSPRSGGFPTTGIRKLLVIMANFSNTAITYPQSNFDNYMNQVNYNNTGSFRDYYLEVSYGQLTVNTTVTAWVTLPNTHNYYGPESMWGQFALDAITAAKNQTAVNFADFDNDANGVVDGVAIFHQGVGQEESGNTNDIWSHSWELSSAGFSALERTFDGVLVESYTTMPERNSSGIGTIGVMCHEFGHNLGSPDFYDTNYSSGGQYTGTGNWDMMAGGSWNGNSGDKPAHHNAYTKAYVYGWTSPTVLTTAQKITLRNASVFTDVVRYNTSTPDEFYLLENRQKTGFDADIPGHGLIIFHVDGNYISLHSNANNINAGSHQGMYPVCASSTGNPPTSYGSIDGAGCPFPGSGNKTSFSDATTPNSHSWAGADSNFPLTNIAENTAAKEISFCFINCSSPDDPITFTAIPAGISAINLAWGLNPDNASVMVAFSTTPTFGIPVPGMAYAAGNTIPGGGIVLCNGTGISFNHTGLSPSTAYYYKAWSVLTGITYSTGVTTNTTTLCPVVNTLPFTEGFSGNSVPNCWSLVDHQGNGQGWQFGTISGPVLTGNYAYLNSDGYGSGSSQNADLLTPTLDLSGYSAVTLQFKHYFKSYTGSSATLSYSINSGTTWTQIQQFTATSATNPATFNQAITAVAGQSQVKFKWNFIGAYAYYWSIDDVSITGVSAGMIVSPSNQGVIAASGTIPFAVTTTVAWTAASNADWCTVTPSGTGNGTLTATYSANLLPVQRMASITATGTGFAPVVVTVTQAAAPATLAITPPNRDMAAEAGNTSFDVISNSTWNVTSDQTWCSITASGSGNGMIAAACIQNLLVTSRTANITVTVAGLSPVVITVTQAGALPILTVTPSPIEVMASAGDTTLAVTSNTDWTVTSDQAWCTVNLSGTGSGPLTALYSENLLLTPRVANITVTVEGLEPVIVSLTQAGALPTLAVSPLNQDVTVDADTITFEVTSNTDWTVVSDQTWCLADLSGTGNGTLTLIYDENLTVLPRIANITVSVSGLTPVIVTISQAAAAPLLSLSPANQDGTEFEDSVEYAVTSNTDWTAISDSAWCKVTESGSGNGIIIAHYEVNPYHSTRIATISVTVAGLSAQTVTLTQAHSTVSVPEFGAKGIMLFPNPTKGLFRIALESAKYPKAEVTITDLAGATILKRICHEESEYNFDLSTLPQGCYFVKIKAASQVMIKKLVLIR